MIIKISHCIGIHVIGSKYILCVFLQDVHLLYCFGITYETSGGGILLINEVFLCSSPRGYHVIYIISVAVSFSSLFVFMLCLNIEDITISIQV